MDKSVFDFCPDTDYKLYRDSGCPEKNSCIVCRNGRPSLRPATTSSRGKNFNFTSKIAVIKKGEKLGQGIFEKYMLADNDVHGRKRTGGFGSTGA